VLSVPKDLRLPFDPIARAGELWRARWGESSQSGAMVTATSIMRVQQLLLGEFDAIAGRHGLTFARYEALVLLAFSREGRLSMGRIGERLMVHPTSATHIVQRLAAQGFVDRVANPDDRRGALAVITDTGREAMEATTADLEAAQFGLGMLSSEDQARMFALLRDVRVAADDFVEDPGAGGR
jgi:DNA-binding MarR family transcriptional regulator